jgi:hypothetical protein
LWAGLKSDKVAFHKITEPSEVILFFCKKSGKETIHVMLMGKCPQETLIVYELQTPLWDVVFHVHKRHIMMTLQTVVDNFFVLLSTEGARHIKHLAPAFQHGSSLSENTFLKPSEPIDVCLTPIPFPIRVSGNHPKS